MKNSRIEQTEHQYLNDAETRYQAYADAIPARAEAALTNIDKRTEKRLRAKSSSIFKKAGATALAVSAIAAGAAREGLTAESDSAQGPKASLADRVKSPTITKTVVVNGKEARITVDKNDATPAELVAQYHQENGTPVENYPNANNE